MPNFIDYTGKKIGRLTFIDCENDGRKIHWNVLCECGNKQSYRGDYLSKISNKGKVFECYECKMKRRSPLLLDQKYGRLSILGRDYSINRKGVWYLCQCDCGKKTTVTSKSLSRPKKPTRSCGCYMRKIHSRNVNTTQYPPAHGMRSVTAKKENKEKNRIYNMRTSLASACYCTKNHRYSWMGAKGYTLCDLWRNGVDDFYKWVMDHGYELGKAIYIKDGEKEYGPSTCYLEWRKERFKTTNAKMVTYNGETHSLSGWAKKFGVSIGCISMRILKFRDKYGLDKAMNMNWIPERTQSYGTEHYEKDIVELYSAGLTYKKITDKLGCSAGTIKRFLIKNNIPIRPAAHIKRI